ncbi:MAG: aminoacetone oxidase family FAD-binding enzyme [Chloroflexi bacterium]|nr:aminoacetone oxidase family FAD-binding enzyme [Chloroflexota bacterium]
MARGRRIGVVGAGPAGILAALEAAHLGARVLLFDTNPMIGRKLLVTGNGRCNISNVHATAAAYHCADARFLEMAFRRFGHPETVERLRELGILIYATPDGWCYPLSESAAAVADLFAAALELAGVEIRLKTKITALRPRGDGFTLEAGGPGQTYEVDRVVVATGGKAHPALGSKGEFFAVLEALGHTVLPIRPALVPLVADMRRLHKLQGVRLDAGLTLWEGERRLGHDVGNLLFTSTGLSGPAAMNLSYLVSARPHAPLTATIDLLAIHREALFALVACKRHEPWPLSALLGAVWPQKVPPVVLQLADLPAQVRMTELTDDALNRLFDLAGHIEVPIKGTRGFEQAQLSTGGVPVTEVHPETMASRIVPGLHLAGELLDVHGPCGGYNLQFAFTSGALAGRGAAGD